MREIKVPKVPARAFDKNRRLSDLIRRQVEHLAHVAGRREGGAGLAGEARRVRTEGQAAAYIGRVTAWLRRGVDDETPQAPQAAGSAAPPDVNGEAAGKRRAKAPARSPRAGRTTPSTRRAAARTTARRTPAKRRPR